MSESENNAPKRSYQWPWFVLAAVALGIVLAVLWMSYAVKREREQRDFNAPLPGSSPR